jgi:hypothetical protein
MDVRNDAFGTKDHLLTSILEVLMHISFDSAVSASAQAGKEYQNIAKDKPKPITRPTVRKPPVVVAEKPRFATTRELIQGFNTMHDKPVVIVHTEACVASQVNKGGGSINCSCPSITR